MCIFPERGFKVYEISSKVFVFESSKSGMMSFMYRTLSKVIIQATKGKGIDTVSLKEF